MSFDMSGLPDMVYAPFDDEQVALMNRYQNSGDFHPYTCCDHQTMVMTREGLTCPKCQTVQNWCLRSSFMRNI